MANCSNSESMSLRQLSLNTWSDIPNRPCRHGAHIWKTALNSLPRLISFTVPTISFRILYVFLVLSHERRHVVHFSVTSHPTAEWTSQQLLHAFPYDSAPQYIIRDRDCIYGADVQRQLKDMGIHQVLTAPRSPWQSLYVERLIGSIRRECLDHVIVITEESLRATLRSYFSYYYDSRCHLGLNKDSHNPGKSNCPIKVVSLKFRKSVGFIIATSAAQPDHPFLFPVKPSQLRDKCVNVSLKTPFIAPFAVLLRRFWQILASKSSSGHCPNIMRFVQMEFLVGKVSRVARSFLGTAQ